MRKNITRIFTVSIFILLALLAVVSSVFEVDFYKNAQNKYHVSDNMNLLVQDVDNATLVALLYTRGEVSELEYFVSTNDQLVDLYSTQDKEHMIDVKNLYSFAYTVFISMFFVSITLLIVIFFMKISAYEFFDIVNKTSVYLVGIIIVLALFAYINFDVFWTLFHKVLFTNDLWYMNPHKDALVNLFPEQLFMDLVFKIIARFITFFASFNAGGLMYKKQTLRGLKND